MRDKIAEIIRNARMNANPLAQVGYAEADALIANGFILPPCKVGDNLYCVYSPKYPANPADKGKWFMTECEVARFHYGVKGLSIDMYGFGAVNEKEFGKTVFLTKEEAEKALKEKENG